MCVVVRPCVCVRVLRLIEFLQNDIYGLSHCSYIRLFMYTRVVRLPARRRNMVFFIFVKVSKAFKAHVIAYEYGTFTVHARQ